MDLVTVDFIFKIIFESRNDKNLVEEFKIKDYLTESKKKVKKMTI